MRLVTAEPGAHLAADGVADHHDDGVRRLAVRLRTAARAAEDDDDRAAFARLAFEFVRDEVAHSWDAQDRRVTLTASEVLAERVGLCFGKSHLLVALLRSQGIPAGLCYQRLVDDDGFCLHGLVAEALARAEGMLLLCSGGLPAELVTGAPSAR